MSLKGRKTTRTWINPKSIWQTPTQGIRMIGCKIKRMSRTIPKARSNKNSKRARRKTKTRLATKTKSWEDPKTTGQTQEARRAKTTGREAKQRRYTLSTRCPQKFFISICLDNFYTYRTLNCQSTRAYHTWDISERRTPQYAGTTPTKHDLCGAYY